MKTRNKVQKFTLDKGPAQCYNSAFLIPIDFNEIDLNEVAVQGYCVRCRAKQEMLSATRTLMKNGRRAMVGLCGCCGTKMSVAGKWDDEQELSAQPQQNAAASSRENG